MALFGDDVVALDALGIRSGRNSRGHRFHHDKHVWIGAPADYIEALRAAHAGRFDERRARIVAEVETAARAAGGSARIDADNLAQVNCLNEWPVAVACSFERAFLEVPQEALVATMETNQKFFPVLDAGGRLTEHFIGIANIESHDPSEIRKGYKRATARRFADAEVLLRRRPEAGTRSDGRGPCDRHLPGQAGQRGRQGATRGDLAEAIAPQVGVDPRLPSAPHCWRRTTCSRAWSTYSRSCRASPAAITRECAGEPAEVALAIDEAYQPRFAGDDIALSGIGKVLAIAERLDTLAGGFAAGLKPTVQGPVRAAAQCAGAGADDHREWI